MRLKLEYDYESLFRNNYYKVSKPENADILIYDTCAVTHRSDSRCISDLQKLDTVRKNGSKLVVCGCMTKISRQKLEESFQNSLIIVESVEEFKKAVPNLDYSKVTNQNVSVKNFLIDPATRAGFLHKLLKVRVSRFYLYDLLCFAYKTVAKSLHNVYVEPGFHILISKGCLDNCSYCAIRIAKKNLKSKPPSDVIEEFERGLDQGYRRFFLWADDPGCYGKDIGTSLPELLNKMVNYKGDFEINLLGIHFKWLAEDYEKYCKIFDTKKIHRLYVPLQSGSDRILKLMNREYDIATVRKILKSIAHRYPMISLQTGVIVGFPTETPSEFQDTVSLIDEIGFDDIHINRFSPRPGTVAYSMNGRVPEDEINRRYEYLKRHCRRHQLKRMLPFRTRCGTQKPSQSNSSIDS